MKCEMPNNPDRLANSDKHKNIARHVPLKSDHNTELMTEAELIIFLRIPEISSSKDYHNVIEHLKRIHELPRVSHWHTVNCTVRHALIAAIATQQYRRTFGPSKGSSS